MKKNLMAKAGNVLVSSIALGVLPIAVTYSLCKEAKNKIESKNLQI